MKFKGKYTHSKSYIKVRIVGFTQIEKANRIKKKGRRK